MINKICVYTICKNEIKYVEKWLKSMSEADYMCVLDTGSTDGTYELFNDYCKQYPQLSIHQVTYEEFRFDLARNDNINFIPDDANILMENDLDEVLESGWAQPLRERWIDGKHTRGEYNYVWSHLSNGSNGRIFKYNKIHNRDWIWKAPVHELLVRDSDERYSFNEMCDLTDCITLHHYPDYVKPRSNYLDLLIQRCEEDPNDKYGKCYLADQYYYLGKWQEAIDCYNDLIDNYTSEFLPYEIANFHLIQAECYAALGNDITAQLKFTKAIVTEPTLREPYIVYASWLVKKQQYNLAIAYIKQGLRLSVRRYVYTERDSTWNYMPYDLLAQAYYWTGDKIKSLAYAAKAMAYNNKDQRLVDNFNLINKEVS